MKPLPLIAALAVGGAALWSAGWYVGKSVFVEPEADRAVEDLRAGRLFFSYRERAIGGFPFGYDVAYHDVSVSDSSTTWRWTAPELHIASGVADAGKLTLSTSPTSVLEVTSGGGVDAPPTVFEIETDDLAVELSQSAEGASVIDAQAARIAAVQKGAGGLINGGRLVVTGMDYTQRPKTDVTGDMALTAESMEIAYRMSADGVTETWTENVSNDVSLTSEYDLTGYDAAAPMMFVTEGGSVVADMKVASTSGRSGSSGGPSSPPFTANFSTGVGTLRLAVGSGRMSYGGAASDSRFDVQYEEGGPLPNLTFDLGEAVVDFSMPTEPSPDSQPYALMLSATDLELDEGLWAMFDAGGALPRDPMFMRFDVTGEARIFRDLMALQAAGPGGPPIELETLVLRDVRVAGLGAAVSATGELDVRGVAAQPDGEVTVVIDGALALIDQLTAAGLLPPGAGDVYKSMGQQILRPGEGDDQFIADIASRRGQVTVNGVPMGGR